MMSEQAPALSEFRAQRDTRRAALLAEYRELVVAMADGSAVPSDFAGRLDDIMVRLRISDADLSNDIEVTRQHNTICKSIAKFQAEQPQLDKRFAELTEKVGAARKDLEAANLRLTRAQHARTVAGQPHNRNRADLKRAAELVNQNPRLFGPLDHG